MKWLKKLPQKVFLVLFLALALFLVDKLVNLGWLKSGLFYFLNQERTQVYQSIVGHEEEINQVKQENSFLRARLLELEEENSQYRRLLESGIKPETKLLTGKILGLGLDEALLLVEKGKPQLEASVVSGRVLLGQITQVQGKSAKVKLLTSPELNLPVKVWLTKGEAQANEPAVADGILASQGGQLFVGELLSSEEVKKGNWVGAVAENGQVFLIGQINKVQESGDKIFQTAEIDWLADLSNIITVGIID